MRVMRWWRNNYNKQGCQPAVFIWVPRKFIMLYSEVNVFTLISTDRIQSSLSLCFKSSFIYVRKKLKRMQRSSFPEHLTSDMVRFRNSAQFIIHLILLKLKIWSRKLTGNLIDVEMLITPLKCWISAAFVWKLFKSVYLFAETRRGGRGGRRILY